MIKIKRIIPVLIVILAGIGVFTAFSLQNHNVDEVEAVSQYGTEVNMVLGSKEMTPGYYRPGGISVEGNIMVISDSLNNRILLYDKETDLNQNYQAFLVLGQPDIFYFRTHWGTTASSISGYRPPSTGINNAIIKNGKIISTDLWKNRVLIWNDIPTENNAPADIVLGQTDFTSEIANNGGISSSSLYLPRGVATDGTRLVISDSNNNRILIWTEMPTTDNESADLVLGQPDFVSNTANNGGISSSSLYLPGGVYIYNEMLFIADSGNSRVLIWKSFPEENNQPADFVIGQPDFISGTANNGGITADSLNYPFSLYCNDDRVYVSDSSNNRVLIYNGIPGDEGWDSKADYVLGQGDVFNTNTSNKNGISANSLYSPFSVYSDGNRVYVADGLNSRVLIYSGIPGEGGWNSTADYVLGQMSMTRVSVSAAFPGPIYTNPNAFYITWHLNASKNKVLVTDEFASRVLIWNSKPSYNYENSDIVLGQDYYISTDINRGLLSPTAGSLSSPSSVWTDEDRVMISDYGNNRVLIWNEFPIINGEDADIVLGQSLMTTKTSNEGGRNANSLYAPTQVYSDGIRVYVADRLNHRILIWNEFPTTNKESADLVIGQPNFTSGTANNTSLVAGARLSNPYAVWSDGTKLVVGDYLNHRVLIWNEFPTVNGESADIVLGQPDMSGVSANNGGVSASSLNGPAALTVDSHGRLYVTDRFNHRVLIWNEFPTTNREPADIVIGQTDFTSNTIGYGETGLNEPRGISVDEENKRLYVSDKINSRVVVYPLEPQGVSITPVKEYTNNSIANLFNLASTDAKEMMVSLDSSFSGLSWEPFSTSKLIDLPVGDGLKSVFAKFRDFGNYESSVLSATVVLDTVGHKPVITQLGLIKNIPNKDSLYYYFTANKVRIYGTSEVGSTVQFERSNGTKYTTQADAEGKFLIVIDLPNGETKLTYSSTDLAGNVSGSRTITLNIDPSYGTRAEATSEDTVTPDEEEISVQTEQEETPVVKSLLVVDSDGNILSNKTIVIEGKEYKADDRGYIHTDQGFTSDLIASIEGRNYTIKPSSTYLTLTEVEKENQGKLNSLYYIIPIALFLTIIVAVFIKRRSR